MSFRRGATNLGCLFGLLLMVAMAYFGFNVGEAYWRSYKFEDAMRQEVRFALQRTNPQITSALRAKADSLGLPDGARRVQVRRTRVGISISAAYVETVELPLFVRRISFTPHVERTF
ncbi:MAG: hypothetical protein ACR2G6_01535 [Gemmatimonadaceae bacterium]